MANPAKDKPRAAGPGKPGGAGGKEARGEKGGAKAPAKAPAKDAGPPTPPRLRERFQREIVPALKQRFGYGNELQVPRLRKVVLNMGLGEAVQNVKVLDAAVEELAGITGQRPAVTRAKKSEAAFKIRAGMPIGCRVTLRGARMYEFLDRFLSAALPRIRDFRGLSPKSFDGRGNYALGVKEQLIFPEVTYDKVDMVRGMDICIETTARTDEEGRALLESIGFPFRK
jgi:large subunit ribosomal protein L5